MMMSPRVGFLICLIAGAVAFGEMKTTPYDPGNRETAKNTSFVDFILEHLNPADRDYGQDIETAHRDFVAYLLGRFPLLLAIGLLLFSFGVILHQHHERSLREMIASRFLAWYHNELTRARAVARQALTTNKTLIEAMQDHGQAKADSRGMASAGKHLPVKSPGNSLGPAVFSAATTAPLDHDLLNEITRLRLELASKTESQQALTLQINQLNSWLEEEKQRNRVLKGG